MAKTRLTLLCQKFEKNPDLKAKYKVGVQDLPKNGYALKMPEDQIECTNEKTWYLRHNLAIHCNKDKTWILQLAD